MWTFGTFMLRVWDAKRSRHATPVKFTTGWSASTRFSNSFARRAAGAQPIADGGITVGDPPRFALTLKAIVMRQ